MPISTSDKAFVSHILSLMQPIGDVIAKRMFGGHGLFLGGLMFGLISDGVLYFKTNTDTLSSFKSKDLLPFSYMKKGKRCELSYFEAPEECLEDPDEMSAWAQIAFRAAAAAHQKMGNK